MKRKIVGVIAVLVLLLAPHKIAQAHVLLVDKQTNIAAVFHTNPQDDPIAGEDSELYFDIQDKNSEVRIPYDGYSLLITDEVGNETAVKIKAAGSTVIAEYVFPSRGLYRLDLKSLPQYDDFQKVAMSSSLRVNRGVGTANLNVNKNQWANVGLIGSGLSIVLLAVTFFNNRKNILAKSKF